MSDQKPEKQPLWLEQNNKLFLRAVRCDQCNGLFFPPQYYGCEACGAPGTSLQESLIIPSGSIVSFTTVHLNDKVTTPYQLAEVATGTDQPIRARLDHPNPKVGDAVAGALREYDDQLQFVFVPEQMSVESGDGA